MLELTTDNFEEQVLKSEVPVIVDFQAPWCQPCGMIAPTLEQLDTESGGNYRIGKVNIDEARALAIEYDIQVLPTLKFFHEGRVINTLPGVHPAETILSLLPAKVSM